MHNASHGPLQSLVGAGSRLAARSWVSPELAAQPAATHSRFSLRFLLRACCPGKSRGSLHNPLHNPLGEPRKRVEKCRNLLRTTPCHECQGRDDELSTKRARLPVDLTNPLAAYGNRFSSDIVSDEYYLYLTCALGARSFLLTDLSQKIDSATVIYLP